MGRKPEGVVPTSAARFSFRAQLKPPVESHQTGNSGWALEESAEIAVPTEGDRELGVALLQGVKSLIRHCQDSGRTMRRLTGNFTHA